MTVLALRTWVVEDGVLTSPRWVTEWTTETMTAECIYDCPRPVVDGECCCGFWGLSRPTSDMQSPITWDYWNDRAVGVVAMSGMVQPYEQGFRAEQARIVALVDTSEVAPVTRGQMFAGLRKAYPVAWFPSLHLMLREFPLTAPDTIASVPA